MGSCQSNENKTIQTQQETDHFNHQQQKQQQQNSQNNTHSYKFNSQNPSLPQSYPNQLSQQHQQEPFSHELPKNNDLYNIYSNQIQNNSNQLNSNRNHSQYPSGFSPASTENNTNAFNGEQISAKNSSLSQALNAFNKKPSEELPSSFYNFSHPDEMDKLKQYHPAQRLPNGSVFVGEWISNKMDGNGLLIWPDGSKYEGFFIDGKRQGKGRFTSSDGDIFEGEWLANKNDGLYTQSTDLSTYPSERLDDLQGIPSAASSSQTFAVVQLLLNEVRALAAQNQRTEQSLRDLQQQIHLQKGKRVTFIQENEYKENDEQAKPARKSSLSIQPTSSEILSQQQANGILVSQGAADHLVNNNPLQQKPLLSGRQPIEILSLPRYSQLGGYPSQQSQQHVPQKEKEVQASVAIAPVAVSAVKPKPKSDENVKVQSNAVEQTTLSVSSNDDENVKEERDSVRFARFLITKNFLQDILDYLRANEEKTVPRNCLARHNIPAWNRAKMIDWMIQIMKEYQCTEETFFMGVRIMDTFLQKSQKVMEISDLNIIGVACMFIVFKFEEIYPIKLQEFHERIANKEFSKDQIKDMEAEILQTLNFNLLGTSPYEIVMHTLAYAKYQDKFQKREFAYAHKICLYLSKMVLYDYEFNQASYSMLAASIIFIVFKIFRQIKPQFASQHEILNVLNILKVDLKDMVKYSTRIIHLAKNFEEFFPFLPNLKKFNKFEIKLTNVINGEIIFCSSRSLPQSHSEIFMLI